MSRLQGMLEVLDKPKAEDSGSMLIDDGATSEIASEISLFLMSVTALHV